MPGTVSVVIPAHNEAPVIAGTLRRLIETDPEGRLQLVVAANGCTDQTAAVAAAVSPRVHVVEVAQASKIAALNAGDDVATAFPRVYLDADVSVSAVALLAVADALNNATPLAGAPRMEVDATGASLLVRWQYRVWELSDYRNATMIGSGVYALAEAGRARFGRFPDVIADDAYVLRLFARDERVSLANHVFIVAAPRTLRAYTQRLTRIIAGNEEIADRYPELHQEEWAGSARALTARVARRPSLWLPAISYFGIRLVAGRKAARMRGNWTAQTWNQDRSTRV